MSGRFNVKLKVLGAFRHLLVPLVRVLLRNAVGFHEFTQIVREVYVKVAIDDFAPSGGAKSTPARVAVITGLTRRELATFVSDDGELRRHIDVAATRLANLLQGWHTDSDFVGPYGVPRDLFFERDPSGLQTFNELVRRYGGGASARAILRDLAEIDATSVPESGEPVRVLKRTYIPESMAPDAVEVFARGVRRYSETVQHNFAKSDVGDRLFERWVFPDDGICERDWEVFHALVSERLQELVRELDTKFAWFESPQHRGEDGLSVGVGIYVYRDSKRDQEDWEQLVGYSNAKRSIEARE